jgi:L-ascorbate metabolism protein UlaG (beta-lactamase superfamily)
MTSVRVTHVGGPTTLIEAAGWRLLTDPTFDAPGRRYSFGWGTSSRKLAGPALAAADLGDLDAALVSHDHHADNLDDAGRGLLPTARAVVTTRAGAKRLAGDVGAAALHGLAPWESVTLEAEGKPALRVTATPCRHGPPLSRPIVGDVVGFALRWEGQEHGELWVTGDTVLYDDLRRVPERVDVGTLVVHLGKVQFPITGPLRYSMTAADALELARLARPHTVVPVHYEGWAHFREGPDAVGEAFAAAPDDLRATIVRPPIGTPVEVTA